MCNLPGIVCAQRKGGVELRFCFSSEEKWIYSSPNVLQGEFGQKLNGYLCKLGEVSGFFGGVFVAFFPSSFSSSGRDCRIVELFHLSLERTYSKAIWAQSFPCSKVFIYQVNNLIFKLLFTFPISFLHFG